MVMSEGGVDPIKEIFKYWIVVKHIRGSKERVERVSERERERERER